MKILVTAKRVEDPESKIKVKPDGSGIVQEGLKYKINPFDEIAVEEGLRLAAKHGGEVVVVSHRRQGGAGAAPPRAGDGRHQGRLGEPRGPAGSDGRRRRCSRRSSRRRSRTSSSSASSRIDDDQNQVGQYLAEWLGWGQATFASKVESLESERRRTRCRRIRSRRRRQDASAWSARSTAGCTTLECTLPGGGHHRPAPEPAALRVAARHHEGEEQADRGAHPGGARRGRHARRSR